MAAIYLIEHDAQFRALLLSILKDAGHHVIEADLDLLPVEHYRQQPAPVVVVDLFARGNEGLRAALAIRSEFPTVQVVGISRVWTVWNLDGVTASPLDRLNETLAQPFGAESLLDAIRRAEER